MIGNRWLIVGAGKSSERLAMRKSGIRLQNVVACNRVIELIPADYWIWVDRFHFERSRWHSNAKRAITVHPDASLIHGVSYRISREWPCLESELYLSGGALTIATHFALRMCAKRIVFVGCDAWTAQRDRYHAWDGMPFTEPQRVLHEQHLVKTSEGVRRLANAHPNVEFLDATSGPQHLGFPQVNLEKVF